MTTAYLFGKLREHELEMNRLNEQESEEKQVKGIALRSVVQKTDQESSDCSDTNTLNLLRKFGKFLRKNNKDKSQSINRYNFKKTTDFNFSNYTCFGCGRQRHIKVECPNTVSKDKVLDRKYEKRGKTKRAYIAWQNNDDSSSSSTSRDEEEAKFVLDGQRRFKHKQCKFQLLC